MAGLGFRTLDEMIGRSDCLEFAPAIDHWKAAGLDLAPLLYQPAVPPGATRRATEPQDAGLAGVLDHALIAEAAPALDRRRASDDRPVRSATRIGRSGRCWVTR